MESIFSIPAAFFGDLADDVDVELYEKLRIAMNNVNYHRFGKDVDHG